MNRVERTFRSAVLGLAATFSFVLCVIAAVLLAQGHDDAWTHSREYVSRTATSTLGTVNRSIVSVDMMLAEIGSWVAERQAAQGGRSATPASERLFQTALREPGFQRLINFALHQNLMLSDIVVLDDSGEILASAKTTTQRLGLPMPKKFFDSLLAQPFAALQVSTAIHNPATSAWVLYLARAVDLNGAKRVVIAAEIQVPLLSNLMNSGPEEDKLSIVLENDEGSLLASFPDADALAGRKLLPVLSESSEATIAMDGRLNGEPSIVAVRRTLYPGVMMAVGQPQEIALADWRSKRNVILFITAVLLALTCAAAVMALRYLEQVTKSRKKVAQANASLVTSNDKLAQSLSMLKATLESTPDAVVVVGRDNKIKHYNSRFIKALKVPEELLVSGNLQSARAIITSQVSNTDSYFRGAIEAYASVTSETQDLILFKDGKVFERRSIPQILNGETIGRVWSYRDITAYKETEKALLKQQAEAAAINAQLQATLNALPDLLFEVDVDGRYLAYSAGPANLLGASADQVVGRTLAEVFPAEAAQAAMKGIARAQEHGSCYGVEIDLMLPKGARWFELSISRKQNRPGETQSFMMMCRDITTRKESENRLKLAATVFMSASEGIAVTDAGGSIVEINDTFAQMSGYRRGDILGRTLSSLQSDELGHDVYAGIFQFLEHERTWRGEIWNRRQDGDAFASFTTISAIRNQAEQIENYVALFTDITVQKRHEQQLEHITHFDPLTQLPNRTEFAEQLRLAMQHSQKTGRGLAVVFVDLDDFEQINKSHSVTVGNEILIALSRRMRQVLRQGDTLARFGGDEFFLVLTDLDTPQSLQTILQRLLNSITQPLPIDGAQLTLTASVGVTLYPQDQVDADLLVRHADQAMVLAKSAGKNRIHVFDVEQDTAVQARRESVAGIQRAVEHQQLALYYQPKVNMRTGRVIGAEALLRWQHPERGLLPPSEFLPSIENLPIAIDIGDWVIESAVRQSVEWRRMGLDLPVSVNISAEQLQHGEFVSRLRARLESHPELPSGWLELEILETSAMKDIALASDVMRECHKMGVSFALDDFGTGYSSLTYLKRLPAEVLKIDQSFIRDMVIDPGNKAIVEGVIGLARAFNRDVIAEGVETHAHSAMLLGAGCDLGQGFGIARPMQASAIPAWVAQWHAAPRWLA